MQWGPACRISNLLESNSWYQGLRGRHTPGRVGLDSHMRRLTGRLICKWDGLDQPLAHPLLRCRGPLFRRYKTYEHLFILVPEGNSVEQTGPFLVRILKGGGQKACSTSASKYHGGKRDTRGSFPNDIPPKGMWQALMPVKYTFKVDGASPAVNRSCSNSSTVPTGQLTGSSWWSLHHEVKMFHFKA